MCVLQRCLESAQPNSLKVYVENIVLVFTWQSKFNEEHFHKFVKNVFNLSRFRLFLDQILNIVVHNMTRVDAYLWVGLLKQEERQLHDLVKLGKNTRIYLVDFGHLLV